VRSHRPAVVQVGDAPVVGRREVHTAPTCQHKPPQLSDRVGADEHAPGSGAVDCQEPGAGSP